VVVFGELVDFDRTMAFAWKDLHSTHPENSGETRRTVKAYGRMDIQ
jgi:hypothetical protein